MQESSLRPTYTYDANGNTTAVTSSGDVDTTTESFTYNARNQLVGYTKGADSVSYGYDGTGMRVSKTQGTTTQKYYWDRGYIANEGTGSTITASNFIGADGIIARKENNVVNYLVKNAHGDVIKYVGASNTKHYDYDPYGNELNANPNDTNPFRYAGEYFDAESGQIYLRNRYYSPGTGRFTQEDPIRDGTNWYVYCAGNPVMYVDPWGLVRGPGYNAKGEWSEDPDADDFGKDSDTYKILCDLGDRWMQADDEEKAKLHELANTVRRLAREGTPIQYAQDKVINQLHENKERAINYQHSLTNGFSGFLYVLAGGNWIEDSSTYLIGMSYGEWNYKYDANWQVPYEVFDGKDMNIDNNKNWYPWMYFDGMLIGADKVGNLNMAYVGTAMNVPYTVFQNCVTNDKDDAFWVQYGIDMANQGR